MSDASTQANDGNGEQIAAGAYELLQQRLSASATELASRAHQLNNRRVAEFGATTIELVGGARIRTENSCVPRDVVQVGELLLFGYNVFIGLRETIRPADVFALHRLALTGGGDVDLHQVGVEDPGYFLADPRFEEEFIDLYRYYKAARLLDLVNTGERLLAAFQIGATLEDVRVFRWRLTPEGDCEYIDSRGDRDYRFPPRFDFEWTPTGRADHRGGRHPAISVIDEVFIDPTGGSLELRAEDNTPDGAVILVEPVDDAEQSLADCMVDYAVRGSLILLRITPYRETHERTYVFNRRSSTVTRLDAIALACQTLPEDHGVIFPGGFHLQDGEHRAFDVDTTDMEFESVVRSPNGEDVLYTFSNREVGSYVLLSYNQVRKDVHTPIQCHGVCRFDDGHLVVFRDTDAEPTRVHPMQVWRTPYVSDEHQAAHAVDTGPLARIGNAELVRGISDALTVGRLARSRAEGERAFEDLIAAASRTMDAHHWLDDAEVGRIADVVRDIREIAGLVLDEFAQVKALRETAATRVDEAASRLRDLDARSRGTIERSDDHTSLLAQLREHRGTLVTLRDLRYVDEARLEELDADLDSTFADLAERTVEHLAADSSFDPFHQRLTDHEREVVGLETTVQAQDVGAELDELGRELDVVSDVVSGLDVADPVVRTSILGRIGEVVGVANRVRALLERRRTELAEHEGRAEFGAEFSLVTQSVAGALAQSASPEAADEQLGRMLVALENLESRFGAVAEFASQIHDKRDDVYDAFAARKQALVDDRLRTAERLDDAATRVLATVTRRAASFSEPTEVAAFFAGDPMIERLRSIVAELRELGEVVRADEILLRLSAAGEQAQRGLRDQLDIFEDGGDVIRFGAHRFSVNSQALEASLVPSGDGVDLLLVGTDYREPVVDPEFEKTRPYWNMRVSSESPDLSRAEYLAGTILLGAESDGSLADLSAAATDRLVDVVRAAIETRFAEGYERGVHDADAALILAAAVRTFSDAGLLRVLAAVRSAAQLFWAHGLSEAERRRIHATARAAAALRESLREDGGFDALSTTLVASVAEFCAGWDLAVDPDRVAGYLAMEVAEEVPTFATSTTSVEHLHAFRNWLSASGNESVFLDAQRSLGDDEAGWYRVVDGWVRGWLWAEGFLPDEAPEIAASIVADVERRPVEIDLAITVEGLLSDHDRIVEGRLVTRLDDLLDRVHTHAAEVQPGFAAYQAARHGLLTRERERLRLEEFVPNVMSGFVRNRLIDEVYLPLIGDNLAKQLGTVGGGRVDQSGVLLLISPPGYGKTTLMEYVADRLGLVFVKVNGPALGTEVTSLDPAEAPDATARQEVERINFAFEMGNNVLLYLDDIQHTNPELLQKFISLSDGQRRVEGVWNGRTRTYDLRGKRFAVVMAANPYTESGESFQIPDMLANRADTWNLGDVLSGREEQFALSYLQNALTSNAVLAPLAGRDPGDLLRFVDLARGEPVSPEELSHPYSAVEIDQITRVVGHLLRIQEAVLAVNLQYIASAATADDYRTEPPFRLQGSYRNMNRLAEKVVPVMSSEEVEDLLDDHYIGEAQTLAAGAEENTLKLRQLRGVLTEDERARWDQIVAAFAARREPDGPDPVASALGQLDSTLQGALESLLRRMD